MFFLLHCVNIVEGAYSCGVFCFWSNTIKLPLSISQTNCDNVEDNEKLKMFKSWLVEFSTHYFEYYNS